MENKETFNYTYCAKEQEEIKAIRKKYSPSEECEDKMTRLRRLDASVTQRATVVSLVFGIIGALIMGLGMSLAMTDIGELLGFGKGIALVLGIVIGLVGIALVSLAYPAYCKVLRRERERHAPEIIKLADELLK